MSKNDTRSTDTESLELLSGLIGEFAAGQLWDQYGSLTEIGRQSPASLQRVAKTPLRKIKQLLTSFKLAASMTEEKVISQRIELDDSKAIADLFREKFRMSVDEELHVALVDGNKRLIETEKLTPTGTTKPRITKAAIFGSAIKRDAAAIILAHSYPRSSCDPSEEDLRFSRKICEAGTALDIPVLDHVIFGQQRAPGKKDYSSLYDLHLIGPK